MTLQSSLNRKTFIGFVINQFCTYVFHFDRITKTETIEDIKGQPNVTETPTHHTNGSAGGGASGNYCHELILWSIMKEATCMSYFNNAC